MRRPTPEDVALAHWRHSVGLPLTEAGLKRVQDRHDDDVEAGFYKTRLKRGGPFVPVLIVVEADTDEDTGDLLSDEKIVGWCYGERISFRQMENGWHFYKPITQEEFLAIQAEKEGGTNRDVFSATHKIVDLSKGPILP